MALKADQRDFDKTTRHGMYSMVFELTGDEEAANKQGADIEVRQLMANIAGT